MAKMVLSLNGTVQAEFPLDKERVSIGRKPDNDISIDNLAVSGKHAMIITILDDSFLEDLGSTNGTYVNGKLVKKHALRNGLIPVLTLLASVLPVLIGGSIVVETVFDIQGMGKYAFEGLLRRDYAIIMATTVLVGITTQFGILISDVAYSLVDPRIQHD